MRQILKGSTDRSVDLYIIDSTDGTPETGVLYNTAGIDLKYRRDLSAAVSITEATLAALTTAHADGGFLEIGNGVYRLDLPDAAFATGADHVTIYGTVTGMIVLPVTVQLINFDPEAALATPTNITAGTITTTTNLTNLPAITANWLTAAGISATALNGKGDWNIGKTGYALSTAGIQAIWDAATTALTTIGSVGKLIVDNLDATISSRMASYTQPTGFLAATFPATVASPTNITAGTIGTVTTVTNDVGITQTAADKVFGASGASMSELTQAAPSATPSPRAAIMLLYMALRNVLSVTATTKSITNDAGTVIAKKALTDDGTTYSEAEMVSGP